MNTHEFESKMILITEALELKKGRKPDAATIS